MPEDALPTFESAASRVDAPTTRTTAGEFAHTLETVLEPPAVGTALPFEGVELPDSVVSDPTPSQLDAAVTGVTAVEFAVADYGSIAIRSSRAGEEAVSLYADRHVAVVARSDVVPDMAAAFERLGPMARQADADVVLATGPSATADMGALVTGAHGPKTVRVVVIEDR